MIDRRTFAGILAIAGATLMMSVQPVRAQPASGTLIQRAIPSSGEMLPVIGLAFSNHPGCADHGALKDVVKTFAAQGGRYYDATLGNVASQRFHMDAAKELGLTGKFFLSTTGFVPGPGASPAGVRAQIDSTLARSGTSRIDVAWVNAVNDPALLAALKEEKKAGRVRYIGVLTIVVKNQSAQLEALMRNEPIDFIGVDYDISNRHVEETILPLARERKIGVVALFPFSNNSGVSCGTMSRNLFARVGNRPLPDWAAEFDARTWAQFFLKYVISHPAVTVARVGTTKSSHMIDNMAGGVGRLPDEATRKRMAELVDALPALPPLQPPAGRQGGPPAVPPGPVVAVPTAILDRYVGEYRSAAGTIIVMRRDGDKLIVKPGTNPEVALIPRSETRFQDPRGPIFEFQVDSQGRVTGAILEQQGPQGPQRLPLTRT